MRRLLTFCFLVVLTAIGLVANAQTVDGLTQDAKGRYTYTHVSMVPDVAKEALYGRLQPFVVDDLNASDTYLKWDEVRRDSIVTVAFFELDNSPEIQNQVVDCKAKLVFGAGTVTLTLAGFNYSAIVNNTAYGRPLYRMNPVPYFAQSYAKLSLAGTLQQLGEKMDKAAAGPAMIAGAGKTKKAGKRHQAAGHTIKTPGSHGHHV